MGELLEHRPAELLLPVARSRLAPWQIAVVAPLVGATVGAVARWWMRLISDDPEFSWDGTIFIVLAFTIAGTGQGLAWAARRAHLRRRWTTPARVAAAVLTLPMFAGAGAIMLPTVLGASLARYRTEWPRVVRLVAAAIALPPIVSVVADVAGGGLAPGRLLGILLFIATYTVVVMSLSAVVAPIRDGWRLPRSVRILAVVAVVVLVLFVVHSVVGVPSSAP